MFVNDGKKCREKIWVRVCHLCPSILEKREKLCVKMRKVIRPLTTEIFIENPESSTLKKLIETTGWQKVIRIHIKTDINIENPGPQNLEWLLKTLKNPEQETTKSEINEPEQNK